MSKVLYRGFFIDRNVKPIPTRKNDWDIWHEDFDGYDDSRSWSTSSLAKSYEEIDEYWEGQ